MTDTRLRLRVALWAAAVLMRTEEEGGHNSVSGDPIKREGPGDETPALLQYHASEMKE